MIYVFGDGQGEGPVEAGTIGVEYPAGATCTVTNGSDTYTALDTSGAAAFVVEPGTWTVTVVQEGDDASQSVTVTAGGWVEVKLDFRIPTQEYQELAYLEFTGTQYINTGAQSVDNVLQTETEVIFVNNSNNSTIFGTSSGLSVYQLTYSNSWFIAASGGESPYGSFSSVPGAEKKIVFNDRNKCVQIGDDIFGPFTTFTTPTAINIGWRGDYNKGRYRYKYFNVYDKNTAQYLRKMYPVRRRSDNVLGMWDSIEKKFYSNAGSGTFLAGEDI